MAGKQDVDYSLFHLSPIPLSNAGMPILLESEVEVKCEDDVTIIQHIKKKEGKQILAAGIVMLTNLRIVSIVESSTSSKGEKIGWGFNLSDISLVEDCTASYFGRSSRIHIEMRSGAIEIGLKFLSRDAEKESFLSQTKHFISKKSWIVSKTLTINDESTIFSVSNAGVAGILRRQEQNLKSVDTLARDAMSDLDSLMKRAKEVAVVVQRYAAYAGERAEGDDSSERSETTSEAGETTEINEILQSIGITSPVTRFSAGKLYHKQLARQLADFLLNSNRLIRMGGMITLADIYGIFNRARGTELVSPDDFLKSSEMIGSLNVGISIKKFPSGVCMLRLDSINEESMCQNLLKLATSSSAEIVREGIQAAIVAQHFNLSMVLAQEFLLIAEKESYLCRDDSIGGLSYFPNKFNDIQ
jgi:ESCRT-II complex subunit VPS36